MAVIHGWREAARRSRARRQLADPSVSGDEQLGRDSARGYRTKLRCVNAGMRQSSGPARRCARRRRPAGRDRCAAVPSARRGCARPMSRLDALERAQQIARGAARVSRPAAGVDELRLVLRPERRGAIQPRARDEPQSRESSRQRANAARDLAAADRRDCCRARRTPASSACAALTTRRAARGADGDGGADASDAAPASAVAL